MNKTIRRRITAGQIINNILNWVADLIQLAEEEQRAAGIYLGNQNSK